MSRRQERISKLAKLLGQTPEAVAENIGKTATKTNTTPRQVLDMVEDHFSAKVLRVEYHDNGQVKKRGLYRRGRPYGLWQDFASDGRLLDSKVYH